MKFTEIIMILHAAILARGLSFFLLLLLPNSTHLSQEHNIIHNWQPSAVFQWDTHMCTCVSENQIIDQRHQNENAWSWIINCLAQTKKCV